MKAKLERTFHAIGQGAFYTEKHNFNGKNFIIVYDCGSTSLKRRELEMKIEKAFPQNSEKIIDILFISHFHADHTNGIEFLAKNYKIKRVVIPLIDDEAKILLQVSNLIEYEFSDTRLIDSPEDFFGVDTQIIRISPVETDATSDINVINTNNPMDISNIENSRIYPSGTVFTPSTDAEWFFIPFNYKHLESKEQFETALKKHGLTLIDIDTIDKIKEKKKAIVEAYKIVKGDLNKSSMILFSGKDKDEYLQFFIVSEKKTKYTEKDSLKIQSGCLYMGDINLNIEIVNDIYKKLYKFLNYADTFQVPHHGSKHSFSDLILQNDFHCAIFSYSPTNSYGHPNNDVKDAIISKNICPYYVTEDDCSMVTQKIIIKCSIREKLK